MTARIAVTAFAACVFTLAMMALPVSRDTAHAGGTLLIVNTPIDEDVENATCSLREAIIAANNNANYRGCTGLGFGVDGIEFALGAGIPTINITSPLPNITDTVTIDGAPNKVELRGPGGPYQDGYDGLTITSSAPGTTIRRLVINSFPDNGITAFSSNLLLEGNFVGTTQDGLTAAGNIGYGVIVAGASPTLGGTDGTTPGGPCTGDCNLISGNGLGGLWLTPAATGALVQGNFVGVNAAGDEKLPNVFSEGILIGASGAMVGGNTPEARNVVFGTQSGIRLLSASSGTVQGNFIGTGATGNVPLGGTPDFVQALGVGVQSSQGVMIGGGDEGGGNVIANSSIGISLTDSSAGTQVAGNLIGVGHDGTTAMMNGLGIRIQIATNNLIGGTAPGEGNTIANSSGSISSDDSLSPGIRVDGAGLGMSNGNSIRGNSIYENAGVGINLAGGGNNGIAPPVITSLGSVHGTACAACTIDVYSDDDDEGRIYEGSTNADSNGDWTFAGTISGPFVTATATDANGNTSEFSAPVSLATPTPTPSPTPTATAAATPTPTLTPTPTPTGTPMGQEVTWGDNNCSGAADPVDALLALRHDAGLSTNTGACPAMGTQLDVTVAAIRLWGDVDCDGSISPIDSLKLLRFDGGLSVLQEEGCPGIGTNVTIPES